jgi:Signal peptidase, peptidase S26
VSGWLFSVSAENPRTGSACSRAGGEQQAITARAECRERIRTPLPPIRKQVRVVERSGVQYPSSARQGACSSGRTQPLRRMMRQSMRLTSRIRRKRVVIPVVSFVVLVAVFAALWRASLIVPIQAGGSQSMAPTFPACNGRWIAEGFTDRFRDPHRGEVVAIHARGQLGGAVVPDPEARDLNLGKRVIAIPGDLSLVAEVASSSTARRQTTSPQTPSREHVLARTSTSSSATIGASYKTAATSAPYHAMRSSGACFSSTGQSHDSACPATTTSLCRLGKCAGRDS